MAAVWSGVVAGEAGCERPKPEGGSRKSEGHDHLVIVLRSNGGYENEKNCQFFALFVSGFGRMRGVPVE